MTNREAVIPEQHRHAWAVLDLLVRDGRPTVRQRCPCGVEREVRAFDRTWEPPSDDEAVTASTHGSRLPARAAPQGDAATTRSAE